MGMRLNSRLLQLLYLLRNFPISENKIAAYSEPALGRWNDINGFCIHHSRFYQKLYAHGTLIVYYNKLFIWAADQSKEHKY